MTNPFSDQILYLLRIELFVSLGVSILIYSCNIDERKDHIESQTNCIQEEGVLSKMLRNYEINEASGLAASINNPNHFWTHNDSGDRARIFLIDSLGQFVAEVSLLNVVHHDWEDIAVGPGPILGLNYIYVGEIGDNFERRTYKNIYRFVEPFINSCIEVSIDQIDTITFRFSDGIKDAETLMIDPPTRDLYVLSKHPVGIYRVPFPQALKDTLTLERQSLSLTEATGGDILYDGSSIIIKNYKTIYCWKRLAGETVTNALMRSAQQLPYTVESQGEGIAWSRDGSAYYTISEEILGSRLKLCKYSK